MQDHHFDIWRSVRTTTGIRVTGIRPSGEVFSGVLVVVSASPQGNEGLVLDEDFLDTHDSLLLYSWISGRGILGQVTVSFRIAPGDEVELALTDLSAIQVLIVQVVRSGATNHTTEHQLIVIFPICAQGVVVVLTNCHVFDFDANSL